MPSCHLGALPCEMGGRTIACLMSRTNMRLDRSSERKYHKDLCMCLCLSFFSSTPMNSWACSSIPQWFYSLHELFQIESDPFSQQTWFGISNSFTEGMTEGDSIRLVLTDTDLRDTFLFFFLNDKQLSV